MRVVMGAGYLEQTAPSAAAEAVVNGRKQCSKCQRWLLPYEFESKGIRSGRQVRRGVCNDCRSFRTRGLKPLDWNGENSRTCNVCGRTWTLDQFDKIYTRGGRGCRTHKCRLCRNAYQRGRYRAMRWHTTGKRVRPHKPYCQPYRKRDRYGVLRDAG